MRCIELRPHCSNGSRYPRSMLMETEEPMKNEKTDQAPEPFIRYGDLVCQGQTLIAAWMKGGWYRFKDGPVGKKEWVHIDPNMGPGDAAIVAACEQARRV